VNRLPDDDDSNDRELVEPSSGRVQFDDRGNAVWQSGRRKRLENPALSIADDEPAPQRQVQHNRIGLKSGYDPYASGVLKGTKKEQPRKNKDLRALSRWIQLKKNMGNRDPG
jgi:hypothetical protein